LAKAYKGKFTNDDDIIIVPIETKIDNRDGNQNSYLWVYTDKYKKNKALIVDFSGKKMATPDQINLNNFSGLMTFREYNGDLINGFQFDNGKAVSMVWSIDNEDTELKKGNKKSRISSSCYNITNQTIICVDYSWISCVSTNLGQTYFCQWSYDFQVCVLNAGAIIDVECGFGTTTGTNSSPTTGSSGSSTSPTTGMFFDVIGKICGNYTFTHTGNGLTAEIHNLASNAYHTRLNKRVYASFGTICISFGSSIGTSNNASIIFIDAWNYSLRDMDAYLKTNPLFSQSLTDYQYSSKLMEIFRSNLYNLSDQSFGLSVGPCSNIAPSYAQYCL
jgi:hypothetical protein